MGLNTMKHSHPAQDVAKMSRGETINYTIRPCEMDVIWMGILNPKHLKATIQRRLL